MNEIKLVCDENILGLEEALQGVSGARFSVLKKAGREISRRDLQEADVLLCRSVTEVNEALLRDTALKFIGSATSGLNHIDLAYLEENNIAFSAAHGANANAVAEYVVCNLAEISQNSGVSYFSKKIAIVGHGNVGKALQKKLQALAGELVIYDPYLQKFHPQNYSQWEQVLGSDVISFHVPYTIDGDFPTHNLLNEQFFSALKSDALIINAARGEICDEQALLKAKALKNFTCVWDVWHNEPDISETLLNEVDIATAHIAGYSYDAKVKATLILVERMSNVMNLQYRVSNLADDELISVKGSSINEVLLNVYRPSIDSQQLKAEFQKRGASAFDKLRKHYHHRKEFRNFIISEQHFSGRDQTILQNLGFSFEQTK